MAGDNNTFMGRTSFLTYAKIPFFASFCPISGCHDAGQLRCLLSLPPATHSTANHFDSAGNSHGLAWFSRGIYTSEYACVLSPQYLWDSAASLI